MLYDEININDIKKITIHKLLTNKKTNKAFDTVKDLIFDNASKGICAITYSDNEDIISNIDVIFCMLGFTTEIMHDYENGYCINISWF